MAQGRIGLAAFACFDCSLALVLHAMPFLLLLIVAVIAYLVFSRSREIFVLRLRSGTLTRLRGNVPPGLLSSFRDVLNGAQNGTIKASRTPNGAHLATTGVSESVQQRMRNIFGLYPASKLFAPSLDKRRAAHDVLTIAWFLSLFRR